MNNIVKISDKEKLFGIVYTPKVIIEKILNDIGYDSIDILGKIILDPACGDGRFLAEIAKRIIDFSPKKDLKNNLLCINGWDIDENSIKKCLKKLDHLIKDLNISIEWNVKRVDSIKYYSQIKSSVPQKKFDFIVGNPPYVRIQNLDKKTKRYIQDNYHFCKSGSTDIFIAFFEMSYNLLKNSGICALVTPNSFFYTRTAMILREFFQKKQNLLQITNYGKFRLFKNVVTFSAITIFNKKRNESFLYQLAINKDALKTRLIDFKELRNSENWQLSIDPPEIKKGKKLKEICNIHVGISTLCDKAFIFEAKKLNDKYFVANTKLKGKIKLEKDIIKPIIKGSKLKNSSDPIAEYIIFPYTKINGKNKIIEEKILMKNFPKTYKYLLSIKETLNKRDNAKPNKVAWYAFGRNQSLDTGFGKKIVFSPINKEPKFIYHENENSTIYSSYFIKYNGDHEKLLKQLNSEKMKRFIDVSGRDFKDGWKAYNKKIIENFDVELD